MHIPIPTLHLFPVLDEKLIALLRSLTPDEWHRPTLARLWVVKDIAAHLLDGNMRTLSMLRDRYAGDPPGAINSYQDLVGYLNRLNADWVKAFKRISPAVITDLLESTGKEYHAYLQSLPPFEKSSFAVSWAGEEHSFNWFHIARDYTEKWHHQQQIREAVNRPGIESRELYYPVLDTFMQALPHHYRNVTAPENSVVSIKINGDAGGQWLIRFQSGRWTFLKEQVQSPDAEVVLEAPMAWKLFTKAIPPAEAEKMVRITGNAGLGKPVLSMISVMA